MSKFEIHGKRKSIGIIQPEGFGEDGVHPPFRVWNTEKQDYLRIEFSTPEQAQEAINRRQPPLVNVMDLIKQVVEGATVQRRYKENLAWEDVRPLAGIEMLLKVRDMKHLRIKPVTQTVWLGCVDSVHLGWPRPTRVGAAAIIKEQWSTLATKLIRLEFEPETFKVVSCTTEDV